MLKHPSNSNRRNPVNDGTHSAGQKKDDRAMREAYRRERKIDSYLADDENFPCFAKQLGKLNLQLRDIPGDGNCLFRALGDQIEGHARNHFRHRMDMVKYMSEHRKDFEPFVEDDLSFETHLQNLKKLGTYAGNDAIVALARLHQVTVIIHQLGAPFIQIQGSADPNGRQIHIAYHNGDHYSSVRKLNDNTESPANIRLKVTDKSETAFIDEKPHVNNNKNREPPNIVSVVRDKQSVVEMVMKETGCMEMKRVEDALQECDYDPESTILYLLQLKEIGTEGFSYSDDTTSIASQRTSTDSGVWSETGTVSCIYGTTGKNKGHRVHFREDSYGGRSSGYGSLSSNNDSNGRPKLFHQRPISARKKKEMKKSERKRKAEERHRQKFFHGRTRVPSDDEESVITVIAKETAVMKI
ncbi:hypothetical protein ScPMuIL_009672 [Solemya velum]